MSKPTILIVDNHTKTSMLYASTFEVYLGANVVEQKDIDEAKNYLESFEPDIIVVRSRIEERKVDKVIADIIQKKNLKSQLYVIGTSDLSVHEAQVFSKDVEMNKLVYNLAKDLGVTAEDMANADVGMFYPFKLSNLVPGITLITSIYLKDEDNNFNVFMEKENKLHKEIFNILKLQKVDEVFVEAKDRLKFINSQIIFLSEYLAEDELSLKDRVFIANKAYKTVRESALRMQISPEVVSMTETCIHTMQTIVDQIPKLSQLMKTIEESSDANFNQSLLTSFICNHIIDNIEWGTQEHKVKLTFVSFFHNITLGPEFILINSNERLAQYNMSSKDRDKIMKHALQAAKIVSQYKSMIPMGVDTIIKQHHGSRDGIGFSPSPQSISPLALIFLVADEWITNILWAEDKGVRTEKNQLLNIVRNKYKTLSYEKIIAALEKIDY